MTCKLYWPAVTCLYCYVAFRLLWSYCGPTSDVGGYMPGLELPGFAPPNVNSRAYHNSWSIRLQYCVPYIVFAACFTLSGCLAIKWLIKRVTRLRAHAFALSAVIAFLLLHLAPVASDLGDMFGIWHMPRWLA